MCLTIVGPRIAMRARTDITVYKRLKRKMVDGVLSDRRFFSVHFKFSYTIGYQYKNDNFPLATVYQTLSGEGLHSYSLKRLKYENLKGAIFRKEGRFRLVECVIPKGTPYYRGINDDIISEELIIVKPMTKYRFKQLLKN